MVPVETLTGATETQSFHPSPSPFSSTEHSGAIHPIQLTETAQIRVLLIDDQIIIGEAVRRILTPETDIAFHYCNDPAQAIQTALEIGPTVILQDLVMPSVDGLLLLRWFRNHPGTRDIPIMLLSAKEDPKMKAEAFAQGANDYLVKLPDHVELVARIRYHSRAYNNLKVLSTATATAQHQAYQLEQTLLKLQKTQAQLIQTEKMSSLGQLVACIAHEINNPVNFIHGNINCANDYFHSLLSLAQLCQNHESALPAELQQYLQEMDLEFLTEDLPNLIASMKMGTERIRQIVLSLRNFSRLDEAEMKPVDIHEGIDSTILILHNRLKSTPTRNEIKIVKEYGELPPVECYAGQLNQVFMNLLANAIDALEERSNIATEHLNSVERQRAKADSEPTIWIKTELQPDQTILVRIQDNGYGMSEFVQQRLLEPMFTTKPVGKGNGLGLSISQQIIEEKHQGKLSWRSQVMEGTEFFIQIPTHQNRDQA